MPTPPAYSFAVAYGDSGAQDAAASCFMSLGLSPGPVFFSAVEGLRGSITSQIAVKMTMDAFLERALEAPAVASGDLPQATVVVREAFKEANQRVYQYGHRMGRGGGMGAVGAVGCFADARFTMARVGSYAGFLYRKREVVPLFELSEMTPADKAGVLSRFIGANAQVLVDQASLEVQNEDVIIFGTFPEAPAVVAALSEILQENKTLADRARKIVSRICAADPELAGRAAILALLQLGRPTIVLRDIVEE